MPRKTSPPPQLKYEYVSGEDPAALDEAFNYLFDKFFKAQGVNT